MGQTQGSILNLTSQENKWRSHTELQKQRNTTMMIATRLEKIEFLNWAKTFDSDPLSYIRFTQGQYELPIGVIPKILALGYISDISEIKRLLEDEIYVKWDMIPFGFTKQEWDSPDNVTESFIDEEDEENDDVDNIQLGTSNNLLEEVADESDSEPEPEPGEMEIDEDAEIRSLVSELPGVHIS